MVKPTVTLKDTEKAKHITLYKYSINTDLYVAKKVNSENSKQIWDITFAKSKYSNKVTILKGISNTGVSQFFNDLMDKLEYIGVGYKVEINTMPWTTFKCITYNSMGYGKYHKQRILKK